MKFLISFILIAILSYAACLYMDWWFVAVVAFLVLLAIPQKPLYAFVCGFGSIFLLWTAIIFFISMHNEHLLAKKIAVLILGAESPVALIFVSASIGGLVAGFAAVAGSYTRRIFKKD